ncbi:MAG: DNA polymerase III subunit beta [Thermanaerothrix sp.]|nr:DNA polymerase III subunit beta [Thermanaerothrix sp.]
MKLEIEKSSFIKAWNMAERCAGTSSSSAASSVLIRCAGGNVELLATDMKTSIKCPVEGVRQDMDGEALLPVRVLGDLFKKSPESYFSISLEDGKGVMTAGRSRYRFMTYPVEEFPKIPSSSSAQEMGVISAHDLRTAIAEGAIAASMSEEYPPYLSCAYFQGDDGAMRVVSTDSRRLSYSKVPMNGQSSEAMLLPMKAVRELDRMLASMGGETEVRMLSDGTQGYFLCREFEFSIRRVDSKFPQYERILPKSCTTFMETSRSQLLGALERLDLVVRDFNRMVAVNLSPGGSCTLRSRSPEFGEAVEEVEATIEGEPLRIAFNVRFLMEGVKGLQDSLVRLEFNGPGGHVCIKRIGSDSYLYLLAPLAIDEAELPGEDAI